MAFSSIPSHPVLGPEAALQLERALFGGDESREWEAMRRAGAGVAALALEDLSEAGGFGPLGTVLVLAGKGHNAGDALLAAAEVLARFPRATADVVFAFGERPLRPLAARAWRESFEAAGGRMRLLTALLPGGRYDLCLDGIFGLQYRPPLPDEALAALGAAALCEVRLRAAVDLPTGLSEPGAFRADFTYATGSVKGPVLGCAHAGRPRYLDLGFFDGPAGNAAPATGDRVVLHSVLRPLAGLRPPSSDKRSQGHLAIVGGSEGLPGAVLMATLAAVKSGVGLVTAFVPRGLAEIYAASAPEAMWVGLPEAPGGGLSAGGLERFLKGSERATAILIGPGLGRSPEAHKLATAIVRASAVPLVVDADALQADIVRAGKARRILTPHAGELARVSQGLGLRELCQALPAVVVAKGPVTRISAGDAVYHSLFGGPVLSRGGSGDLLAGLTGGLLAQMPGEPLLAACRAAVWHGSAADHLARAEGQAPVRILQWLDHLAPALREAARCRES
jgi:NAD(P)H-hydrate epimerase